MKNSLDFAGKFEKPFNYIISHYEFRFNVVISQYEYRPLKRGKKQIDLEWIKFEDRVKNNIMLEIFNRSMDITQDKMNIMIESELVSPDYNPFEEYFLTLKEWDKKTDYIDLLSKTVKTASQEHFSTTLKKFLVGVVDCLLNEDSVNDVCLVFQSSQQGVGKSRWMRKLLPEKFRNQYLYEGDVDTKNKDHVMHLSQYWFIHLDELETLKGKDIGAIKSYITRQRISLRKAFGRYKATFVRRASFLGSVNDDKFLTDITGNRRWLVFETRQIDYDHLIDIDGLWAQVYWHYRQGFRHWFDIEEIKEINKINEEFRSMATEEEQLLQLFEFLEDKDFGGEWLSGSDVIHQIGKYRPGLANKMLSQRMGRALSRHCKQKKTINGVTKYHVKYIGYDGEEGGSGGQSS